MVYEFLIQWSLKHPNILDLYGTAEFMQDSGGNLHESASRQSLLMPLKINGNTRDYIARRTQAGDFQHHNERSILQTRIHNWVVGIVKGLAYLHSENIVHGDLRGYNIIVDDDQETTLLTDFGLSVFADGMSGNHGSTRSGNYLWQPLEILAGENKVRPKKSTDIYFFGGVLIELYTGYDPYYLGPGDPDDEEKVEYPSLPTILEGLTRDPPKHPDRPRFHSNETIDLMQDELWSLTLECWKTDRHQRPTVEQLLERIPRMIQHIGS
ncbi:kinase-like domain-containing protein [Abortiporus biennis]|nr:kinase-like domain-containing protein [Abortiporus biennis]